MSFPSCIKIPTSKINASTETSNHSSNNEETITYDELISIANEVFGFLEFPCAFSHKTMTNVIQGVVSCGCKKWGDWLDYVEYVMGKYLIGCAAFVKVQLTDGSFHEALGYSYTESSVKGSAILSARTLSITQALRKALLCFAGTIQERISKSSVKAHRAKEKPSAPNQERINETPAGGRVREVSSKERASRLSSTEEVCQPKRSAANQEQPVLCLKSNKSPKPIETDEIAPLVVDVGMTTIECQEILKIHNGHNNLPHKDKSSATMTDEEIRLERKRKQKQKQEEYKKLMMEKNMKSADKPNPKY